jgi:hypothetical protein
MGIFHSGPRGVRLQVSGIERAFQLAKSAHVRDIDELRVMLKKEGYSSSVLTGPNLKDNCGSSSKREGTNAPRP